MKKKLMSPAAKYFARQLFLDFYWMIKEKEICVRACIGNPAAIEILERDRQFRREPSAQHYEDLHIALDEFRRAQLN